MLAEVRCGSSLCENSDVELVRRKSVSITFNNKRTALTVTVERRKERKQFCAFSARARFHTGWTQNGNVPQRLEVILALLSCSIEVIRSPCRADAEVRGNFWQDNRGHTGEDANMQYRAIGLAFMVFRLEQCRCRRHENARQQLTA